MILLSWRQSSFLIYDTTHTRTWMKTPLVSSGEKREELSLQPQLSLVMFSQQIFWLCPVTGIAAIVLSPYWQWLKKCFLSQISPLKLKHLARASLRGLRVGIFFFFLSVKIKTLCLGIYNRISSRPAILHGSIILHWIQKSNLLFHMSRTE